MLGDGGCLSLATLKKKVDLLPKLKNTPQYVFSSVCSAWVREAIKGRGNRAFSLG